MYYYEKYHQCAISFGLAPLVPGGHHLDIGSLVVQEAVGQADRGLHGAVGQHVDGGGDGSQGKLCQLQLIIMRALQLCLQNNTERVLFKTDRGAWACPPR